MGTRKISQLDTITDSNLSGEAILPVVVSDPLIPNRKAKVNQLFKGVAQGTKASPGLCFDLDRDTGLYQNAYNQLGIAIGDAGFYFNSTVNSVSEASNFITAIDDLRSNVNLILAPSGSGAVKVEGVFRVEDTEFIIENDSSTTQAKFDFSQIGGTAVKTFQYPEITNGNSSQVLCTDTAQTITNKTINIADANLFVENGSDRARFAVSFPNTSGGTGERTYVIPDPGNISTSQEANQFSSTLIDTKAALTIFNKSFVDIKLVADDEVDTNYAQFNTDALTANRTITMPDTNITLVGTDATQILQNKSIESLVLQDPTDGTKKITFDVSNQNTQSNETFTVPPTNSLNNSGATNFIVTERAEQDLFNKSLYNPTLRTSGNTSGSVTISVENVTGPRTIKFPDADATLLSTENVTLDDVNFGAGIGAAVLSGRTRLQQFFYAGF